MDKASQFLILWTVELKPLGDFHIKALNVPGNTVNAALLERQNYNKFRKDNASELLETTILTVTKNEAQIRSSLVQKLAIRHFVNHFSPK